MGDDGRWLLALDLSGPGGLVVLEGGKTLVHEAWEESEGSRFLFKLAGELMREAGVSPRDLGLLGVGTGPGSFTGIRMAVTAIKTLAEVLEVPVVAPDSLAATAVGPEGKGNVFVALDARRGEVYHALFRIEPGRPFGFPVLAGGPRVEAPGEAALFLREKVVGMEGDLLLVGSGIRAYPDAWPRGVVRAERRGPDPAALAWLCREMHARGMVVEHLSLLPFYLRRPDVGRVKDA
ncbi:MAG: tRNA (adenosine(37)-N6)-threonylcarbamoyltransferase complex dimerization subunit type 1 TsaB [Actinomycetota bacterium]